MTKPLTSCIACVCVVKHLPKMALLVLSYCVWFLGYPSFFGIHVRFESVEIRERASSQMETGAQDDVIFLSNWKLNGQCYIPCL